MRRHFLTQRQGVVSVGTVGGWGEGDLTVKMDKGRHEGDRQVAVIVNDGNRACDLSVPSRFW